MHVPGHHIDACRMVGHAHWCKGITLSNYLSLNVIHQDDAVRGSYVHGCMQEYFLTCGIVSHPVVHIRFFICRCNAIRQFTLGQIPLACGLGGIVLVAGPTDDGIVVGDYSSRTVPGKSCGLVYYGMLVPSLLEYP